MSARKPNEFDFVATLLQHYFVELKVEFVLILNGWATCSVFHSRAVQHFFAACG